MKRFETREADKGVENGAEQLEGDPECLRWNMKPSVTVGGVSVTPFAKCPSLFEFSIFTAVLSLSPSFRDVQGDAVTQ